MTKRPASPRLSLHADDGVRARRATHSRAPVIEPTPQGTLGELDPNAIHTSGIFVDAVVRADMDYCVLREEKLNG